MDVQTLVTRDVDYLLALGVLVVGLVAGYLVGRLNARLLRAAGVPTAVEGTSVERTARRFGTSIVALLARFSSLVIYAVAVVLALAITDLVDLRALWYRLVGYLPAVVFAVAVLVFGVLVGDKVEVVVSERLRGVKVPEIGVIPLVVKYGIVFVAVLVALGQLGVATLPLVIVFAAVMLALIVFVAVAAQDLLASAAAGVYVLLNQPYGIGDHVRIGETSGIVQELDVFVTYIEDDGTEHAVPNAHVFEYGVVKER
ncbi:mechanosensitive ion channel domain-containing protein [Halarchaeum nitratireducens]|uniref:Mechanosensitive ion channel protein MscS n=1 Tax=Halarchaeum nitratireducens TaxID=489913 RepID=A0A830GBU0_9EURY|nr:MULTISPECIES: mechanosensitive ion channel domain-containing protein [Halarchaeum]MBP2250688.1 small-conductance mechanosensitive channel [Halarchaeum solikamskense]GGN16214.1 mechanosensitive ion channel protein MscS [Halarchaeum nitratireducens]